MLLFQCRMYLADTGGSNNGAEVLNKVLSAAGTSRFALGQASYSSATHLLDEMYGDYVARACLSELRSETRAYFLSFRVSPRTNVPACRPRRGPRPSLGWLFGWGGYCILSHLGLLWLFFFRLYVGIR